MKTWLVRWVLAMTAVTLSGSSRASYCASLFAYADGAAGSPMSMAA